MRPNPIGDEGCEICHFFALDNILSYPLSLLPTASYKTALFLLINDFPTIAENENMSRKNILCSVSIFYLMSSLAGEMLGYDESGFL